MIAQDSQPLAPPNQVATSIGPIMALVIAIINTWVSIAAYHSWIAPEPLRIGVIDIATLYREHESAFTRMVTEGNVTDIDRMRALDRAETFARRLPVAIDELSDDCRCVLLPANAVAGRHNVRDLTEHLRARLTP